MLIGSREQFFFRSNNVFRARYWALLMRGVQKIQLHHPCTPWDCSREIFVELSAWGAPTTDFLRSTTPMGLGTHELVPGKNEQFYLRANNTMKYTENQNTKHIHATASTRRTHRWSWCWRAGCSSRDIRIVRITWGGVVAKGFNLHIV